MKKQLLLILLLLVLILPAFSQKAKKITIPDIPGYKTLKGDFHLHTVFSDGLVWPTVRVDEAVNEGIDIIAVTDHIEYRPHLSDVPSDHNRSYDIEKPYADENNIILVKGTEITRAMPPGHFMRFSLRMLIPLQMKTLSKQYRKQRDKGDLLCGIILAGKHNNLTALNGLTFIPGFSKTD